VSRFQGGVASEVEVEQARTQLQTTRAQAIDVGVARAQFEHAVAVLIGKPPASFSLPPLPLQTPPPPIPAGVPSELLERRPDIASAERLMAAANARIGVAKAAYYPVLSLTGTGGFESGTITTLLQGPSGLWSVGASAFQTIFDAGRRRAASDEAIAVYDQTVASYREPFLPVSNRWKTILPRCASWRKRLRFRMKLWLRPRNRSTFPSNATKAVLRATWK